MVVEISPSNMTSNTAPSPYVASASTAQTSFEAYKCFDGSPILDDSWRSTGSGASQNIQIDLGSGNDEIAIRFEIVDETGGTARIKDFTFEGSNNASDWDVLDTVTGKANAAGTFTYDFSNSTSYRYYRVNITANHGASSDIIDEINIYKDDPAAGRQYAYII